MTYLIDYFDLNKRTNVLEKQSQSLMDEVGASSKSEIKLDVPEVPQRRITDRPSAHSDDDHDPLYAAMQQYWMNHDRRSKTDRRSADRRQITISRKLLSLIHRSSSVIPWWQQLTLYAGIVLGAVICSTVIEHQPGTDYVFQVSVPSVFLASALAILISPVAFEKLHMNMTGSFFTRFFLFIQNGVFWYVLLSAFSFTLTQLFTIGLG